jgi:hypothetical protein
MRLFSIAAMLAIEVLPAIAHPCNRNHPTPENPTIILGIVGVSIMMWRYIHARLTK